MLYAVLFEDNLMPGSDVRKKHSPDHLAFLEGNARTIVAAGPLKDVAGDAAGGLWLVEAPDIAAVDKLVREDPFWPTGLRKSVRVLAWSQVFADGKPLI